MIRLILISFLYKKEILNLLTIFKYFIFILEKKEFSFDLKLQ